MFMNMNDMSFFGGSGNNIKIKTINGQSILGEGDLTIESGAEVPENIETTDNKVTTIDENSTDEQYASAKATYDLFLKADGSGGGDSDYTLPIGGDELGGVKNGGNVVINEDGTMTAPIPTGSAEEWEHICDIPVVEDTENPLFKITQSLGADYKKLHIVVNKNTTGGLVATGSDSYPLKIYGNRYNNNNLIAQFGGGVKGSGYAFYSCEIDYNKYTNLITGWSSICPNSHWKTINGNIQKPIHTLVFANDAQLNATQGFRTFTINVWGVRA